jgi:hypothetical protein
MRKFNLKKVNLIKYSKKLKCKKIIRCNLFPLSSRTSNVNLHEHKSFLKNLKTGMSERGTPGDTQRKKKINKEPIK